jgi:Zn-dependent M16 (insulinase) family peptidase
VYQQYIAELPALDDELLQVLPYYTRSLTEIGSGGRDYMATQVLMDAVTGGISASTRLRGAIDDVQNVHGHFVLSGKALVRNQDKLSQLMHETLDAIRWDELGRIREIIAQDRARAEQSVTGNGHGLVMLAASSAMSPTASISHRLRGLAGIHALKVLDDGLNDKKSLQEFVDRLRQIHQNILSAPGQFLLIGEDEQKSPIVDGLAATWQGGNARDGFSPFTVAPIRENVKQMWVTSTQVNFCAKSYPTVAIEHEDAAALAVLGGFLRNGYLHRAIREQGGAYGGGAGHEADIAAFRFFSYRDPRLTETLDDFDRSVQWLLENKHEWRQLEEAILGVIGSIDKPGSPAGDAKKAFHSSLYGRTPEQRQRFRGRVLKVTLDDLKRVGETYLDPGAASVAVITNSATHEEVGDLGLVVHQL